MLRSRSTSIYICLSYLVPSRLLYFDNLCFLSFQLCQRVSPLCLVADDSIFLAIAIANLCKRSHVIPLFPGLGKKGLNYLEKVAPANGYSIDQIEILKKRDLQQTLDSQQRKVIKWTCIASAA